MSIVTPTELDPFLRGDKFEYFFTLDDGYVMADFEEMWFTLRRKHPQTSVVDDSSAEAQAVLVGPSTAPRVGTIEAVSTAVGRVYFPSAVTKELKNKVHVGDLQARPVGETDVVTLDRVTVEVLPDVTRSP